MTTNSKSAAPPPLLPEQRWQWALLGLALFASLLLNLLVPPAAPIHPNTHGIQEIRAILDPGITIAPGQFYGPLYVGFMRFVCALGGWQEGTVYTTNAILGALSVLALFSLARTFGYSTGGALLAAGLLAIHPAQVWLAGSEGPMMIYLLLLLSGLTLLTQGLQRGSVGLLWAGALAISLACRLHVLTLAALPLALGVVAYTRTQYELPAGRRFRLHAVLAAISCVALWGTHLWELRWVPEAFAGKVRGESSLYQFTAGNILFDPTLTALAVLPLVLWGATLLCRHQRPLALLIGWAFLVLVPAGLLVNSLRTDAVRYQTPTHWVLFLLAGAVISFSPQFKRATTKAALALLGAAILANAAYGWSVVHHGTIASRAYTFTRQAIATIEGPATLHLPHLEDDYRRLLVDIPIYDEPIQVVRRATPASGDLVYLGLDCYRDPDLFAGRFDAAGQRLECVRACAPLQRVPIAETTLHRNPPRIGHHHLFHVLTVDSPTIGLYRCLDTQ
jgi:hypothetical protein